MLARKIDKEYSQRKPKQRYTTKVENRNDQYKLQSKNDNRFFTCNKIGHFKRNCPNKKRRNESLNTIILKIEESAKMERPMLKRKINEQEITALIDSGALTNLIAESAVKKISGKITPKKTDIKLGVGEIQGMGAIQVSIQIKEAKIETQVKFYVVKNLTYDIIIGTDIMKDTDMALIIKNNSITCNWI